MTTYNTNTSGKEWSGPRAVPLLVDRLHDLADECDEVTIDMLMRQIGTQGHAPLLMIVSLLMVLPTGLIPGVGGALGAIVAGIGVQMLLGHGRFWLPGFLSRRGISAERVRKLADRIHPASMWLRRHLHRRMEPLSNGALSLAVIALLLIASGLSLFVIGAIPVATPLVGLPVALFGIGILARDGAVVAAGYAVMVVVAGVLIWLM